MPFIGGVGPLEWIIILVIVIIIFGVGRLPTVGGALGKSIREFREQARPDEDEEGENGEEVTADAAGSEDTDESGDRTKSASAGSGAADKAD